MIKKRALNYRDNCSFAQTVLTCSPAFSALHSRRHLASCCWFCPRNISFGCMRDIFLIHPFTAFVFVSYLSLFFFVVSRFRLFFLVSARFLLDIFLKPNFFPTSVFKGLSQLLTESNVRRLCSANRS